MPKDLRAVGEAVGVLDIDAQFDKLVLRMGGKLPSRAQWVGWIANAPKREDAAPSMRPKIPTLDLTSGINRESSKPWKPGFPRMHGDAPPKADDATLLHLAKTSELLEMIGERELTGDQIMRLPTLSVDEAIAMLEAIPVTKKRRRPLEGFTQAGTTQTVLPQEVAERDPLEALEEIS